MAFKHKPNLKWTFKLKQILLATSLSKLFNNLNSLSNSFLLILSALSYRLPDKRIYINSSIRFNFEQQQRKTSIWLTSPDF